MAVRFLMKSVLPSLQGIMLAFFITACCTQQVKPPQPQPDCCPVKDIPIPQAVLAPGPEIDLFGYDDKPALAVAIETELSKRSFRDKLLKAGMPSDVQLNSRFEGKDLDFLLNLHRNADIYGPDNRQDPPRIASRTSTMNRNIRSTAAVFYDFALTQLADGSGWTLNDPNHTLATDGVCKNERFTDQPAVALCTAFLIDKDVMATASDCAETDFDVQGKLFVFGYAIDGRGSIPPKFASTDVFRGKSLLGRVPVKYGENWAVVQLDRAVAGRDALPFAAADVTDSQPVYMIGYPSGLPEKVADGAKVTRNDAGEDFFVANLDAFKGNSGSPVFDSSDNVAGILFGGEIDYYAAGDCSRPKACPDGGEGCRGELVTRISRVKYTH